jgi:O-antigen/teichoic acid export membrane protein
MTLRDRAFRAGLWTVGHHGLDLVIRLASTLVLTRLLFPAAFGVTSAATALIVGLHLVSDFGIRAVIIQSPRGDSEEFLRSAWVFQGSRGVLVWVALLLICILINLPVINQQFPRDSVFADHAFPFITCALGITVIIGGFESTALGLNSRQLNLRPVVLVDLIGRLSTVLFMCVCAWFIRSAWAIVLGSIAGSLIRAVSTHIVIIMPGPRMAFQSKREHVREILHFGKWVTVSSCASFLTTQSDVMVLGLILPSAVLGIYFIGKTIVGTVEGLLERLQGSLSLPILGEVIRKAPINLRNRYYRFRLPIDVAAGFSAGFLFETGDLIIGILYDPRYSDAGPMVQILAIGLALYPMQLIRSAFTAIGETNTVAAVSIVEALSLIGCLVGGFIVLGVSGAIFGIAVFRAFPSLVFWVLASRKGWISFWHELRIVPIVLMGVIIGKLFLLLANSLDLIAIRHLIVRSH